MEVVPYANATRHINPSAVSQKSISSRNRPAFSGRVPEATLVVPAYRYYTEIQSYISTSTSSNPLGEVSGNLLDHPLTNFVALLCFVSSAHWWASLQEDESTKIS